MHSKTQTDQGDVNHQIEFVQETNGQTVAQVTSTLGSARHDFQITVGSTDGQDTISDLSDSDLAVLLQRCLNDARATAAKLLSARVRVSQLVKNLK